MDRLLKTSYQKSRLHSPPYNAQYGKVTATVHQIQVGVPSPGVGLWGRAKDEE